MKVIVFYLSMDDYTDSFIPGAAGGYVDRTEYDTMKDAEKYMREMQAKAARITYLVPGKDLQTFCDRTNG